MVTNYIRNATYREIYDIHTDTESTSILTFHTPVNQFPRKMLEGFFKQYRRFKYRGATVSIQPTARLPADPEQISYEAGEPGIDPRDMVNPMLLRGYCGDSLGTFLNRYLVPGSQGERVATDTGNTAQDLEGSGFTGSSVDKTSFPDDPDAPLHDLRGAYLEKLYYQSLGDPKFKKIGVQRGFRRFFYPLVYEMATTTQYLSRNGDYTPSNPLITSGSAYGGLVNDVSNSAGEMSIGNLASQGSDNDMGIGVNSLISDSTRAAANFPVTGTAPFQIQTRKAGTASALSTGTFAYRKTSPILTSHKRRLGWLDTDSLVVHSSVLTGTTMTSTAVAWPNVPDVTSAFNGIVVDDTTLPLINMGILVMPKAYKTEMCYRLSVVHHFDFKDYRPMSGLVSPFDNETMGLTPILEWADWEENNGYGQQIYANSSVSSTSKNVELIDVEGSVPEFDDPVTA